jgi:2-polyprenyl-3-methyl-5-hydroxy-6-metoxy-1,4-benzoquinol methylase
LALPVGGTECSEIWELRDDGKPIAAFPLVVQLGKAFDVLRMKGRTTRDFPAWTSQARDSVAALYAAGTPRRRMSQCPCCGADTRTATGFAVIFGIEYRRCVSCAHVFVAEQPTSECLDRMFANNDDYAREYTSAEQIEQRLREIVGPKLDWVRSVYRRHYGRELTSAVDVGAGAGHFVACCRERGLRADGYEINRAAAAFAKTAFGLELKREDFLRASFEPGCYDAVTYWGLLEYIPEPARFVAAARRKLATDTGLLILEVPRAEAISSAIQRERSDRVWRHLCPASHVNIFSDTSIATLLYDNGFRPIAAWYFGMDFYELVCQLAADLADDRMLTQLGRLVAPMQAWLDAAELVDDIIVAAVPL